MRLFVDLFRWDAPVIEDRYEIDQFDTADAVYFVISEGGEHVASLRLLPTDRPNMLDTWFPHFCPAGVRSGETIWENTRLCLPQRDGSDARKTLRNRLISAMAD